MFHSVRLLNQVPLAHGSSAQPSILFNYVIFYSQICSSSYDVEAKYRAMMGMETLVSDSVRPHSDKTRMMCSGTSE